MLIYNFQKEFLGIDEKDLMALGYKNLFELKTEVSDFADLFVKTPGYIHNFKHVHWIDFITCAESYEESKVIINVNNKNYRSTLTITTAFLVDNPSEKAYIVNLNNLRELTHEENEIVSNDVIERPINNLTQESKEIFSEKQTENKNITIDPYEAPIPMEIEINDSSNMDKIDINLDDAFEESDFVQEIASVASVERIEEEKLSSSSTTNTEIEKGSDNNYIYNPSIASEELGLPLDLIEEFIQDFIAQAKEFKDNLYSALDEANLTNIKILSHKLKGVAANLRIEDALETLSIANTSSDFNVIKENLDMFYNTIARLAGEKIDIEEPANNDDLVLDFKNDEDDLYTDPIQVMDSDVPAKIDLPELADDSFLDEQSEDNQSKEIENIDLEDEIVKTEPNIYSKESIANEIGLDKDSFNTLFQDYLQDSKVLLQSIKKAISINDYKTSVADGLRLKGMSDNMRVNSFVNELEEIIHSSNPDELSQAINKIDADLVQLSKTGV